MDTPIRLTLSMIFRISRALRQRYTDLTPRTGTIMCPLRRCDEFLQYSRPAVLYPNFLGTLFKRAQLYYVTKMPQISPMLAVNDGNAAIEFYKNAFGATVLWCLGGAGDVVAGLSVQGAQFFLATEAPAYGTRSPAGAGF